jgi:hypothetical protein
MIYPIVFAIGAVIGWRRAGLRGGDRLDRIHYAAIHGIVLTLAAVLAVIAASALGLV